MRRLLVCLVALLVAGAGWGLAAPAGAVEAPSEDAAIAFYRDRMARDPGDFLTPVSLGAVYLRKARTRGDLAFVARAAEAAERSLALRPEHGPALVLLATARSAEHRFSDARALAARAVARNPNSPDGWAVLGDAHLNLGDLASAKTAYETAHARAPSLQSLGRLTRWRQASGDDEGAIAEWTRALAAGEADGAGSEELACANLERGALHHGRGRLASAESDYLHARELDPAGWRPEAHLAELCATQRRYEEAVAGYERLTARVARPELAHALGDLYRVVGRSEDARPWHDRAETGYRQVAEQGGVSTYHHLAVFYTEARPRPAEAVTWARKDLALRQTGDAYDALAWALHMNGEAEEAPAAIERALATGTKDPHVLVHAALILGRVGGQERSAALLLDAHRRNPLLAEFHVHR